MPTYDYECSACGHRFEKFEGVHKTGAKPCPKCRRRRARRLLAAGAGFIFKGSGFYVTDYKKKSGSKASDGSPSGAEAKPAETKAASDLKDKKKN
jgi:putative FmdB family regulatory protein